MDVLLVNGMDLSGTEAVTAHIGQHILKSILEPEFETKIISFDDLVRKKEFDIGDDPEKLIGKMADLILSQGTPVVGFYTICNTFHLVVRVSEVVKKRAPETFIFYGGPHATLTSKKCMETFNFLDLICLGESERSILPLMREIFGKREFDVVPGIVYRNNGTIKENPCAALLSDDELTKYTQYRLGNVAEFKKMRVTMEGGRGCPFECSFCSTSRFWKRKFRVKPADVLVKEMDKYFELYGQTDFAIQHDMFTANRKHITSFCNYLIEKGSPYVWRCSSRTDVLDKDLIDLMKKAGCLEIYTGIETGSDRMQRITHKNLKLENAVETIRWITEAGIKSIVSFIYGYPDETVDDFYQTLSMIRKIYLIGSIDIQLHKFFPLPATEECDKVIGRAYFDADTVDLSIFNRNVCSEKTLDLIKANKELFLQFYDFKSEVRTDFPYIEAMIMFLSSLEGSFPLTLREIIGRCDLLEFYRHNEEMFGGIFNSYRSTQSVMKLRGEFIEILGKIAHEQVERGISFLYDFEKTVMEFKRSSDREPVMLDMEFDISQYIKSKCFVWENTRVLLSIDNETMDIKIKKIPSWIVFKN